MNTVTPMTADWKHLTKLAREFERGSMEAAAQINQWALDVPTFLEQHFGVTKPREVERLEREMSGEPHRVAAFIASNARKVAKRRREASKRAGVNRIDCLTTDAILAAATTTVPWVVVRRADDVYMLDAKSLRALARELKRTTRSVQWTLRASGIRADYVSRTGTKGSTSRWFQNLNLKELAQYAPEGVTFDAFHEGLLATPAPEEPEATPEPETAPEPVAPPAVAAQPTKAELVEQLAEARKINAYLGELRELASKRAHRAQADLDDARRRLNELRTKTAEDADDARAGELAALQSVDALTATNAALRERVTELEELLGGKTQEVSGLLDATSELHSKLNDANCHRAALQAALDAARAEKSHVSERNAFLRGRVATLEMNLRDAQASAPATPKAKPRRAKPVRKAPEEQNQDDVLAALGFGDAS